MAEKFLKNVFDLAQSAGLKLSQPKLEIFKTLNVKFQKGSPPILGQMCGKANIAFIMYNLTLAING